MHMRGVADQEHAADAEMPGHAAARAEMRGEQHLAHVELRPAGALAHQLAQGLDAKGPAPRPRTWRRAGTQLVICASGPSQSAPPLALSHMCQCVGSSPPSITTSAVIIGCGSMVSLANSTPQARAHHAARAVGADQIARRARSPSRPSACCSVAVTPSASCVKPASLVPNSTRAAEVRAGARAEFRARAAAAASTCWDRARRASARAARCDGTWPGRAASARPRPAPANTARRPRAPHRSRRDRHRPRACAAGCPCRASRSDGPAARDCISTMRKRNAAAGEIAGQHQPGRARAGDQHVGHCAVLHRSSCRQSGNSGQAGVAGNCDIDAILIGMNQQMPKKFCAASRPGRKRTRPSSPKSRAKSKRGEAEFMS